ncbi:MAG: class I SAM-dependent methyltransferase [Francisellaceae bacterium]
MNKFTILYNNSTERLKLSPQILALSKSNQEAHFIINEIDNIDMLPMNEFYLRYLDNKLTLLQHGNPMSLNVDFLSTAMQRRIAAHQAKPALIKAIEGRLKSPQHIFDMTAGLGSDSFMMAARGHKIVAVERNPYIYLIVDDALKRLADSEQAKFAKNITLIYGNAAEIATTLLEKRLLSKPDIVYLDPMFPERHKQAKVKKNMQLLHALLSTDANDEEQLVDQALTLQPKKIVVKRPRLGEMLVNQQRLKPSTQISGKSSRFDVYGTRSK